MLTPVFIILVSPLLVNIFSTFFSFLAVKRRGQSESVSVFVHFDVPLLTVGFLWGIIG